MRQCHLPLSGVLLLTVLAASCSSTRGSAGASPWLEPSPRLEEQIREQEQRLPWTHGAERLEIIQWFAAVGEPAYPALLEMVRDERPDVSGSALAALGATGDERLVSELHAIPWPEGENGEELTLERARTLLRLGDWSMIPNLIHGLRSDRLLTRALCAQALFEATNETHDFQPRGEYADRETAVVRWEAWWQEREQDGYLPSNPTRSPGQQR